MELGTILTIIGLVIGALVLVSLVYTVLSWRQVVPTSEVHIVQYRSRTVSYGKDSGNGNSYYKWPAFLPWLGVVTTSLPMNVFDVRINKYEAYDKGRLPFEVDILAFFRITDSNTAAQRVSSFQELNEQLMGVVQGAIRCILASSEIEEIMQGRSKFGDEFTKEVKEQLSNWGVEPVKNIEHMDIRDCAGSMVIQNIMSKKKSLIEMESRKEVAANKKQAEIAEIEAKREVALQQQQAEQQVGMRKVEQEKQVALADQTRKQEVAALQKTTALKEMEVAQVAMVKKAEIEKEARIIQAEQEKQVQVLKADGQLEAKRREAEGITAEGAAKAENEKLMKLAPVQAQIALAKEIGSNAEYQKYLLGIQQVNANKVVGIEQAKALSHAQVKVIATGGSASDGLSSVGELVSAKGGVKMGAALEGLAGTEMGGKLMNLLGLGSGGETDK